MTGGGARTTELHTAAPPYFLLDLETLTSSVADFRLAMPAVDIYYALKANSELPILETLYRAGCGFEAASWHEIELLLSLNVAPERIIYGTAIKSRHHVGWAAAAGVATFAADNADEVRMLAQVAPGSSVFIRVAVDDSESVFQMNRKFGARPEAVADLVQLAVAEGLVPWGISFNVGSQVSRTDAWSKAIAQVEPSIRQLRNRGIEVEMLNLGGGFPAEYRGSPALSLQTISDQIYAALDALGAQPRLVIEPGRALVATCMTLVTSVMARAEREDQSWLYLDAGVYNALYEALIHQGRTAYPVTRIGAGECKEMRSFVLAGPTGDGLDVIARDVLLPSDTDVDSLLAFSNVGAYTVSMASSFNGFPPPPIFLLTAQDNHRASKHGAIDLIAESAPYLRAVDE
jgi:ornithine decarboxylase